jgi:hypothetical protein
MMIAICSDFSAPFYPEHTSTSTIIVPREQNQIIRTVQVHYRKTYSTSRPQYYIQYKDGSVLPVTSVQQ